MKKINLIGVEIGVGGPKPGSAQGPKLLQSTSLADDLEADWGDMVPVQKLHGFNATPGSLEALPQVLHTCKELAATTDKSLANGVFPCIIGGDHAIAMGTWSGIISHMKAEQKFGLIWVDAHMDSHTHQTTPSNAIHGMPLAALMGHGMEALTQIASADPKLSPAHVVLIGTRSFEEGEESLLKRLNVRVMDREEVRERGFQACFEEALEIAQNGTEGFGVSVDMDAFDPIYAPGVGVPEEDGLSPDEVIPALSGLIDNPNFKALEVVELNPPLDIENKTLYLAKDLITHTLSTKS